MFQSVLEALAEPLPKDDELDVWHEWVLKTPKGIKILIRYLWKDASVEIKERARALFVIVGFDVLQVPRYKVVYEYSSE